MTSSKRDYIAGFIAFFFGICILLASFGISKTKLAGVGPDYLPKVIAIYIIGLSSFYLLSLVFSKTPSKEKNQKEATAIENKTLLLTIALLIAYVALIESLGFLLVSALFLFGQMYVLAPDKNRNKKNIIFFAVLAIVVPIAVYLLFVNVFDLMLPAGILG